MDSINYDIMDDLKYKLREKSNERDAICKSIIPMKEYIGQLVIALSICGLFASALTFFLCNHAAELSLVKSLVGSFITFATTIPIGTLFVTAHKSDLEAQHKLLNKKNEEIEELVAVIKELDKKEKEIRRHNDLLMGMGEKKIIREQDFLDYYIGYIPESQLEEQPKQKTLGSIK